MCKAIRQNYCFFFCNGQILLSLPACKVIVTRSGFSAVFDIILLIWISKFFQIYSIYNSLDSLSHFLFLAITVASLEVNPIWDLEQIRALINKLLDDLKDQEKISSDWCFLDCEF